MDDRTSYTRTALSLHWLVALLIFTGWSLGVYMADLPASPDKLRYVNWHKWIGVTIFMLVVLRASWRATHAPPPLPASTPPWEVTAARVSHAMLYLLMFAVPLTGWLMSSAKGYQTVYFGVLPLPDLLHKNEPLGRLLDDIHVLLAFTLAGVVGVHVAAALKHHFLDRDLVLRRMLPMLTVIALLGVLLGAAAAARVDASGSRVTATFRQEGVPIEAPFRDFRGSVTFDAKDLAHAGAKLEVATASLDLGMPDYNDEVRKPEWFDSAQFPQATFVASKVAAAGADRYTASGTLTLKGRSAPLDVTFTAQPGKGRTVYAGEFALSRKAFGIGTPSWDAVLEDRVVVKFRILATH